MFKSTNSEQSLKMVIFFEFLGSFKNNVTFLGLFIVIVSVLSIFFSDLNLQRKQIIKAVLLKTQDKFST